MVSWEPGLNGGSPDILYYLMTDTTPTGNEMCEGDTTSGGYHSSIDLPPDIYTGSRYIVRDTGILNVIGNQLCRDINMPAPTP